MTTLIRDTHRLITDLLEQGFTEGQAEGLAEAFQNLDVSELATKSDVQEIRTDVQQVKPELRELELRMTLKLGTLIAGGVAFLAFLTVFE